MFNHSAALLLGLAGKSGAFTQYFLRTLPLAEPRTLPVPFTSEEIWMGKRESGFGDLLPCLSPHRQKDLARRVG